MKQYTTREIDRYADRYLRIKRMIVTCDLTFQHYLERPDYYEERSRDRLIVWKKLEAFTRLRGGRMRLPKAGITINLHLSLN